MSGAVTRVRIQAPEAEAADQALADLRAAESLISSALAQAQAAQWGTVVQGDIGRLQGSLRNLLQDLS